MIEFDFMELSRKTLLTASLSISLIGLIIIYFATLFVEPTKIEISDITSDLEGRKISVVGHITQKREHQDGHLFLTLSDGKSNIDVPLFSDMMTTLENFGISANDFKFGGKISVEGVLEIYKGKLQIVPRSPGEIKILVDNVS